MGYGDLSSNIIPKGKTGEGRIFVKQDCTLAGIEEASGIFGILGVPVLPLAQDGQGIRTGETVLKLKGGIRRILAGERVALNILSRMSGIATLVRSLVERANEVNPNIRIACTRKTTPGFGFFEKKAVILGGGDPHRFRLDDAIILKDNHLRSMGSIAEGVREAKRSSFTKKVEVEAEALKGAMEAAEAGADIVMLDNMSPRQAAESCKKLKERFPGIILEVSGGITPDNISEYAESADVISLGYLTHSYRSVDFSLELD
ncbi:MAG: carboxylating nicotinate-nucleotide diphosphorylase [Thermoplasmata archaeon]|nr:carboxylating nicotinate-nucleotide diphosphorylase [Thermoplasmata archaeon]